MQPRHFVFDAYGTLFDVHAAVRRHAEAIGPDAAAFSALWRQRQLEYTWVRSLSGAYRDFRALTVEALDFAFASFPSVDRALKPRLLDAYRTLEAYPEVAATLTQLKASGAVLAILSNGTRAMLDEAVAAAGLARFFDAIFSVDARGLYKTLPAAYRLVSDHYGIAPADVSFQSSNRWDIAGARAFGFRCVWINRSGAPDEYADLAPDRVISDLSGLR
ncbi:MAG: haloacid dehalogenase type II [Rhizobiaceae bacterium]